MYLLMEYGTIVMNHMTHVDLCLTERQTLKLKQLSIISYSQEKKTLSYSFLMTQLQISTIRELQDLIIDMMEKNILNGILNQDSLTVFWTIGRDVESIEPLIDILTKW
jgi:hypothetical protein